MTYHPVTASPEFTMAGLEALFTALSDPHAPKVIITGVNADPGTSQVQLAIDRFATAHRDRVATVPSLGHVGYLNALSLSIACIGNSSSGIIEAPALGVPTINIGSRQNGRARAESIIDVDEDPDQIREALQEVQQPGFRALSARKHPPTVEVHRLRRRLASCATANSKESESSAFTTAVLDCDSWRLFEPEALMPADVFVIAEAGVNHNGDIRLALELVDAAADVGADAVKFQTFEANALATSMAVQAAYQQIEYPLDHLTTRNASGAGAVS